MVHQDSVVGDDGSHRLLVVPCALVVLVLVLMVTACSSAGGDPGQGEGASVTGSQAGGADAGGTESVAPGRGNVAQGVIAEPVVAEDGRMLQPEGHTGLWFETEPADPLEKLVYESQRFVGQPVALEPIGDRALLPRWEDMPDPCHPEVFRRMGELGVEVIVDDDIGLGYAHCAALVSLDSDLNIANITWGRVGDIQKYSGVRPEPDGEYEIISHISEGEMAKVAGCISVVDGPEVPFPAIATYGSVGKLGACGDSLKALQIAVNINGGDLNV
jgi:hypothetical protein